MKVLEKLRAKVGDFWWYSLTIFVACRSGDAIQAFIGLWLVPRHVGPEELGAVLPLQSLAGLFAVPLAVVATVFAKFVNVYATRGEFGKVKCLVRDVLVASAALFTVCIGGAYAVAPFFYERLNVAAGLLTVLILASGFAGNVASLFSSALQGLKMFQTITVQNLIGAPIRLVTLLVAMPFRALSGYILGQATPPAACSLLAAVSLRRRLADCPCDASWRKDLPEILRYLGPYAVCTIFGTFAVTMTATVYRQRLPEVESAAYYMLTRFSDIVAFVACSVGMILFPLASESHERGRDDASLLRKSVLATVAAGGLLAVVFAFVGRPLFSLTATWRTYLPFVRLLPVLAVNTGLGLAAGAVASYELACRRIGATALLAASGLAWAGVLVAFAGCGFFEGVLPPAAVGLMRAAHFDRLANLTWYSLAFQTFQFAAICLYARRASRR